MRSFCFTCHTTSDTTAGWDSDAGALATLTTSETVVGIPRDGGVLHLSDRDGHRADDTSSCYDCHGDSYAPGGHNVHDPASGVTETFAPAIVSLPDSSTVMTSTLDASASVDATGSLDASASVQVTITPDASLPATDSLATTDTLPPLTISDALATYVGTATVTLTAVDDTGGAGVGDTYWTLDGGDAATGTVIATSIAGTHTLTFWSVDLAGNIETISTVEFTVTSELAMDGAPLFAARRGRLISVEGV